jgi:hypothetical protein
VLRTGAAAGIATFLGLGISLARANPASIVPSAADPGDPADLNLRLDYEYTIDSAAIFREAAGEAVDPLGGIPKHRDLAFKQYRHLIVPRADLGVYHNIWLSFAMPIVIAQQRELTLGEGVTRDSSLTLLGDLVPTGGFDARDPGTPLPGDGVFRGPSRKGIDQVHLGLGFALMNQDNDDTKPTWKLGGELRLAAGRVMRFSADDPTGNTSVGRGVHELRVWTSVAKRYKRAESWFEMYWQTPIAEKPQSLLQLPSAEKFGATNLRAGQVGGVAFGVELFAIDDPVTLNRISIDLGARADAHFEGRDYSEMWELFSFAGDAGRGGPLVLDADPTTTGTQPKSHPGVTNIENYLETAGRVAIRAQLGKYVRFAAMFDLVWKTDHVITFADAGIDLPTCGQPGVTGACENAENSVVNPDTGEGNPLHTDVIDLVGHRYHSQDNFGFVIGVQGQILF